MNAKVRKQCEIYNKLGRRVLTSLYFASAKRRWSEECNVVNTTKPPIQVTGFRHPVYPVYPVTCSCAIVSSSSETRPTCFLHGASPDSARCTSLASDPKLCCTSSFATSCSTFPISFTSPRARPPRWWASCSTFRTWLREAAQFSTWPPFPSGPVIIHICTAPGCTVPHWAVRYRTMRYRTVQC